MADSFKAPLHNFARMLRQREYLAILIRLCSRVMPSTNPVLHWNVFVVLGCRDLKAPNPRGREPTSVPATEADIEHLCSRFPERAEALRRWFASGQTCLVIHNNDQIAASAWMILDRQALDTNSGMPFALGPDGVWCHGMYVEPAYRLRGYFVTLLKAMHRRAAECGRSWLYGESDILNKPSIAAHQRIGFQIVQRVVVVCILGLRFYFIRDFRDGRRTRVRYAWRLAPQ